MDGGGNIKICPTPKKNQFKPETHQKRKTREYISLGKKIVKRYIIQNKNLCRTKTQWAFQRIPLDRRMPLVRGNSVQERAVLGAQHDFGRTLGF